MKLVLAGNHEQYKDFLQVNGFNLRNDYYKYISCVEDIMGYHGVKVIRVGTWWENPIAGGVMDRLNKNGKVK